MKLWDIGTTNTAHSPGGRKTTVCCSLSPLNRKPSPPLHLTTRHQPGRKVWECHTIRFKCWLNKKSTAPLGMMPLLGALAFTPLTLHHWADAARKPIIVDGYYKIIFVQRRETTLWDECAGKCGDAATVSLGTEHSRHRLAIHARRLWCCWESSSHPQLFKDWSSCNRVRMCAGPSAQARRLFVAVNSRTHTPRLPSCGAAV